ncbi:MAG: AAA family ATPase [Deltaproteobacteria bacterium]|jgi:DNA polymerase III delta prime subunit|nr:AAA family ATPase [Deltaproteobacteria bacterium]
MVFTRIPLADQSFAKIRDEKLIYADKTKYVHDLVTSDRQHFLLTRPPGFGKTLLISAIAELFSGLRERFHSLYVDQTDYAYPRRQVLSLNLASIDSKTPEIFKYNLLKTLRIIADHYDSALTYVLPAQCLGELTEIVYSAGYEGIVVLIDEYDAPVTRNIANLPVALANAEILRDFLAILKEDEVAERIAFTLVTGVTSQPLTVSGLRSTHLNDISFDPRFAGVCGFTQPEFEALFADQLKEALISFKKSGLLEKGAELSDLIDKIGHWYGGYAWDGETRVLNPNSILNFFRDKAFKKYFFTSSRLDHLTPFIEARPWDFLDLRLAPYIAKTIRESELPRLEIAPVLFYGGYLTIDKTFKIPGASNTFMEGYSFKLPNFEVAAAYYDECFRFLNWPTDKLELKKDELLSAFLAKDGAIVSSIFSSFFGEVKFHKRPKDAEACHFFFKLILKALEFQVESEIAGEAGRLDLGVYLPNHNYLIIELLYYPCINELTELEKNRILAKKAKNILPPELYDRIIADRILFVSDYKALPDKSTSFNIGADNTDIFRSRAPILDRYCLTQTEIDQILSKTLENFLPEEDITKILIDVKPKNKISNKKIDDILFKGAKDALDNIEKRNYHSLLGFKEEEITSLVLVFYGNGRKTFALFGQNQSGDVNNVKPRSKKGSSPT